MSAYMVDRHHIAYLVEAAFSRCINRGHYLMHHMNETSETAAKVKLCNMLSEENARSIAARYPDTEDNPSNAPGDLATFDAWTVGELRAMTWMTINPVQVIKAAHCYRYQACEHDGWQRSEAKEFIEGLIDSAAHHIKGYDQAEWGAPKPSAGVVRLIG